MTIRDAHEQDLDLLHRLRDEFQQELEKPPFFDEPWATVAEDVEDTIAKGVATGTTNPEVANAAVQLQRSSNGAGGWQTAATATTDAAGAFSLVAPAPAPGVYRVRVAPGHGLAPGLSKTSPCC